MPRRYEERIVSFTPAQMFALVADIERYPDFLPWCRSARIKEQNGSSLIADLTVGTKGLFETFTSLVTLEEPSRISVAYKDGPLARLSNEWRFAPTPDGKCHISFSVDFALRSSVLSAMMGLAFDKAFTRITHAFETRARELYG